MTDHQNPGVKIKDMKLRDQIAAQENARHDNDGPICKARKMQDMKMQDMKNRTMLDAQIV